MAQQMARSEKLAETWMKPSQGSEMAIEWRSNSAVSGRDMFNPER
jgi:hypothetical protein